MKLNDAQTASEVESRRVAEASREKDWTRPSFLRELFLGRFRLDLVHPFPAAQAPRPEFKTFFERFRQFVDDEVDPVAIDRDGDYPPALLEGLKRLGAFGMKIPREYGGLGFSQQEYNEVMTYIGSVDGNICALLSAHQSIGVPQPIKLFGTDEQKKRFLPRCAAGAISAFALTEPGAGSDPAKLATTCEVTEDGETFILNGEKLWCTNGTLAELLVVMARDPKTNKISAFVVEHDTEGVSVDHRCRFMGLRALANAVISFRDVRVPRENLIGKEGAGLKIALVTLNTGRLTIPATCVGSSKLCLEASRRWAALRAQWGLPIGRHEAIAHMLSDMAATTYAMEAVSDLASRFADIGGYDIRLEAAAAKEWNSTRTWAVIDDAMQIRGGRGYETEASLSARGDAPIPIERIMRDCRINTIFEGSSEIMHLFMAREAVDKHLQVAGALIDPEKSIWRKLAAVPRLTAFYAVWYPSRWLGWGHWPRFNDLGELAGHFRFIDRRTRKLARSIFHGMVVHGARLQRKQAFLFRAVDIGLELLAMAATLSHARALEASDDPSAERARELADIFCRSARRRINRWFTDMWRNDDERKSKSGRALLDGAYQWLEQGIQNLPMTDDEILPRAPEAPAPAIEPEPAEQPATAAQ